MSMFQLIVADIAAKSSLFQTIAVYVPNDLSKRVSFFFPSAGAIVGGFGAQNLNGVIGIPS